MLPLAIGDGIGDAVAFTVLLTVLLGACLLAAALLLVGYGLRASTDATVAGAVGGVLGAVAAVAFGIDSWVALPLVLGSGVAGFALVRIAIGPSARSPFQHAAYGTVLLVLALVGIAASAAFWLFLLGQEVDVVGAMADHPEEGALLVVLTGAPGVLGIGVLSRLGRLRRLRG